MSGHFVGCRTLISGAISVGISVATLIAANSVWGGDSRECLGINTVDLATVDLEEVVYSFEPAKNGAGPMWCFGNTCVVRSDDDVFVSGLHTLPDAKPLNNCVPSLMRRDKSGWTSIYRETGRTREPSPLGIVPDDRVLLSLNTSIAPAGCLCGTFRTGRARISTRAN